MSAAATLKSYTLMEIINRKKKKKSKSTIIDLVTFKKPSDSITLGDAALVLKICFRHRIP